MISKEFFNVINELVEENNLTKKQIEDAFTKSLIYSCKKFYKVKTCKIDIKKERNEILLYKQYYVSDPSLEEDNSNSECTYISLAEAKKLKSSSKIGQIINIKVNPKDFSFYAAKDFKNRFHDEITRQKRENIYLYFKGLENKLINAKVIGSNNNFYFLELEKDMTTLLPKKEILKNEIFNDGDRIQVYLIEVQKTTKLPKILVSRSHIGLVIQIFQDCIPEIYEGILKIMSIARIPGERTKIGLLSNNHQVDPIGSCIGEKGQRIKNIIHLLKGEKVDLFIWSSDVKELIANALKPALISEIQIIDEEKKIALAIVEDDQLSLAIGKLGKNVKLAVKATKWNIDIKTISQVQNDSM